MSKKNAKGTSRLLSQSGESLTPSSYTLHHVKIKPNKPVNGNDVFDITNMVRSFEVEENIYNPFLQVVIKLNDATNLRELLKLTGNEEIEMLVKRSPKKESTQDKAKWELKLKVAEIFGYVKDLGTKQLYSLRCVSHQLYNNESKVLQRPFQNTIGKLIKDIVDKDLKVEKSDIDTTSKGIVKGIYPTLKPLSAANWLLRNASDDGTHFFFYESILDGLKLKSYKTLLQEDEYDFYDFKPNFKFELGTPESYDEVRRRIRTVLGVDGQSKLGQLSNGTYGSTLYTLNIADKKYEKFLYNYDKKELQKVEKFKPFSDEDKILDQKYADLKNARHYYISLNTNSYEGFDNYHQPAQPTLLKQMAQASALSEQSFEIIIPGDFELCVGKKIKLNIIKSGDTESLDESTMIDKLISGKYLITRIRNNFSTEFTQTVLVQRDSFGVDINA